MAWRPVSPPPPTRAHPLPTPIAQRRVRSSPARLAPIQGAGQWPPPAPPRGPQKPKKPPPPGPPFLHLAYWSCRPCPAVAANLVLRRHAVRGGGGLFWGPAGACFEGSASRCSARSRACCPARATGSGAATSTPSPTCAGPPASPQLARWPRRARSRHGCCEVITQAPGRRLANSQHDRLGARHQPVSEAQNPAELASGGARGKLGRLKAMGKIEA